MLTRCIFKTGKYYLVHLFSNFLVALKMGQSQRNQSGIVKKASTEVIVHCYEDIA